MFERMVLKTKVITLLQIMIVGFILIVVGVGEVQKLSERVLNG